ncbi:hypothetical protein QE390_000395 [Siphonobacter sp. SORGH_AS 1065]|nr:hypothetical protein [Siphonobacter sp. SORGH_AS_1065]
MSESVHPVVRFRTYLFYNYLIIKQFFNILKFGTPLEIKDTKQFYHDCTERH